jgi:hypothetical protein
MYLGIMYLCMQRGQHTLAMFQLYERICFFPESRRQKIQTEPSLISSRSIFQLILPKVTDLH